MAAVPVDQAATLGASSPQTTDKAPSHNPAIPNVSDQPWAATTWRMVNTGG